MIKSTKKWQSWNSSGFQSEHFDEGNINDTSQCPPLSKDYNNYWENILRKEHGNVQQYAYTGKRINVLLFCALTCTNSDQ